MSTGTGTSGVRVALLGAGTVGSAVARLLQQRSELYADRVGAPLQVTGIAVRDASRDRGLGEELTALQTQDAAGLVGDADVVVEVMGGIQPARALIEQALGGGAHVVSANKQLIAHHGPELHDLARRHGVGLDYEAAVVAAVPVLRVVRESLVGDEITSIAGIVNGSTNYVLDLVAREGVPFDTAVRQAGELGYLEADPSEDLDGLDAAAKIVILARTAWDATVGLDDVELTGIRGLTDEDFARAADDRAVIKLVAAARRGPGGAVQVSVRPEALPADDPLARVRGGTNVVVITSVSAGELRLEGAGAGGDETASAVLGDILRAALRVDG